MMKVIWLIQNLVPYHHARFEAFCSQPGIDGVLLQVTDRDAFKVLEFKADHAHYRLRTLFPKREPGQIKLSQIRQKLFDCIDEEKPDVLCVSGFGIDPGIAMLAAAVKYRLPAVIFSESNYFDAPRNRIVEYLKSHLIRICGAGLVGGTWQKEYMCNQGRMEPDSVFFGHNVVDSSHFVNPGPHRFDAPYFFVCARMEEKKNFLRLLDAYAEYRKSVEAPWPLKIAGDGYQRPAVEAKIDELKLREFVTLSGAVPFAEIAPYYWQAGAFVHISSTEQWGLVVNEAMAAGCPLIVSRRCGCAADLVKEGQNGFMVDPFSVPQIAQTMRQMSTLSPAALAAMGKSSEEIVRDFGPARFASGLTSAIAAAQKNRRSHGIMPRLLLGLLALKKG